MKKGILKTCSRGHNFYRSSDCPVCPKCWPGYYRRHGGGEFDMLGAPAQRALLNAKIVSLKKLAKFSESEILDLHGMGPSSIPKLRIALKARGLRFKK